MRTLLRLLLWSALCVLVLVAALVAWASSDGSLAQALRVGAAWLPQGQQLSYQNATGSLIQGKVEKWHWQQEQLDIEGQHLQWRINTQALWSAQLDLPELSLHTLTLQDERPSRPVKAPLHLQLPVRIKAQLSLTRVASTGAVKWQAQDIKAHYTYDKQIHQLQLQQLQWAQGRYSGQLQLQDTAPLALQTQLQASLTGPGNTPLKLEASAQGQLASAQARINVHAQLQAQSQGNSTPQLTLDAQLYPWQGLSQQSAQAQWRSLDAALLWPQAPHTVLDGTLDMRALDKGQSQQSTWQLDLNSRVGQGSVQAQATQTAQGWQGQLKLNQIRSADVYSAIPDTVWTGETRFETTNHIVRFLADLKGQERAGVAAHVRSQGQWSDKRLQLHSLDVRWAGLVAQGQLQVHMDPRRLQGDLQWQWPGMKGQWQGDLQAEQGQGKLSLTITQALQNARWLAQWPQLPALPWQALSHAHAQLQWTQGWNHPQANLQAQWLQNRWAGQLALSAQADVSPKKAQTRLTLEQLRIVSPSGQTWSAQLAAPLLAEHQQMRGQWQTRWTANTLHTQGPNKETAQLLLAEGQWGAGTHQLQLKAQNWPLAWAQAVLGIDALSDTLIHTQAELSVQEQLIRAQLHWDSPVAGSLHAHLQSSASVQGGQWRWSAQAPWQGEIQTELPEMGAWSRLAPPGWRVRGHLSSRIAISGSLARPQWHGQAKGDNMSIRSAVDGVEFHDGRFTAQLQGQEIILQDFSMAGAGEQGGLLRGQGRIVWPAGDDSKPWDAADARVQLKLVAQQLRITNRADRRLVISGEVDTHIAQRQLQLRGQVRADQALFVLPEDTTPTLGKDVRVRGRDILPAATPGSSGNWLLVPDVQVALDLGEDFYVMGQGLTTRLTGQLKVHSNALTQGQPRLQGQLQTVGGLYKAYGQNLAIEQGALSFSGAYDNPQLLIVALRANISERVGVRVTGTALSPAIRLYADPDMPDADKLAWLMLGRSAANGGAESVVLQQAALSLLGGKNTLGSEVAQALGLDEVSLAQGSRADTSATGAALTLGKRLSKDFYMAYESSLNGTFGSLFIFYDLSRRWTLRAQAGDQNTLDLIYTIRKK